MPGYSILSTKRLSTCHPFLQLIFTEVIKEIDNTILIGFCSKDAQDEAFRNGKSKLRFPQSNHNFRPWSLAVDVAPYPIQWKNIKRFYYFAGHVKAIALSKGISLRWGGDWDGDYIYSDQDFNDLVHFELIGM